MSGFTLKPQSEVVVKTTSDKETKLNLVSGNIWANIKKMARDGSMSIKMNQAVAGIKGTTLVLKTDGKSDEIKVIEGLVSFGPEDGEKIDVEGGESASLSDGKLTKATFSLEEEEKDWEDVFKIDFNNISKVPDAGALEVDSSERAKPASGSGSANIFIAAGILIAAVFGFLFFKKRVIK